MPAQQNRIFSEPGKIEQCQKRHRTDGRIAVINRERLAQQVGQSLSIHVLPVRRLKVTPAHIFRPGFKNSRHTRTIRAGQADKRFWPFLPLSQNSETCLTLRVSEKRLQWENWLRESEFELLTRHLTTLPHDRPAPASCNIQPEGLDETITPRWLNSETSLSSEPACRKETIAPSLAIAFT